MPTNYSRNPGPKTSGADSQGVQIQFMWEKKHTIMTLGILLFLIVSYRLFGSYSQEQKIEQKKVEWLKQGIGTEETQLRQHRGEAWEWAKKKGLVDSQDRLNAPRTSPPPR